MNTTSSGALVERLWPAADASAKLVRNGVLVAFGTLLLYVSAKTQVPLGLVQMSMQSLVVVLIGATYGSRLGFATLLAYLAEGAMGLPVFQSTPERGIGLAYMVGPTGGYLVGFLLAATLVGWLVERGYARSLATVALSVAAAHATIHVFGLAWLSGIVGVEKAIAVGFMPFVPADIVKMAISTTLILAMRPATLRR